MKKTKEQKIKEVEDRLDNKKWIDYGVSYKTGQPLTRIPDKQSLSIGQYWFDQTNSHYHLHSKQHRNDLLISGRHV